MASKAHLRKKPRARANENDQARIRTWKTSKKTPAYEQGRADLSGIISTNRLQVSCELRDWTLRHIRSSDRLLPPVIPVSERRGWAWRAKLSSNRTDVPRIADGGPWSAKGMGPVPLCLSLKGAGGTFGSPEQTVWLLSPVRCASGGRGQAMVRWAGLRGQGIGRRSKFVAGGKGGRGNLATVSRRMKTRATGEKPSSRGRDRPMGALFPNGNGNPVVAP